MINLQPIKWADAVVGDVLLCYGYPELILKLEGGYLMLHGEADRMNKTTDHHMDKTGKYSYVCHLKTLHGVLIDYIEEVDKT